MIYLISTDGHKDSIDLEQYFTTEEQIESWIRNYRKDNFNEYIRNVEINFEYLKVTFEWIWCGYLKDASDDEWEEATYYLFKLNQYE